MDISIPTETKQCKQKYDYWAKNVWATGAEKEFEIGTQ